MCISVSFWLSDKYSIRYREKESLNKMNRNSHIFMSYKYFKI